MKINALIHLTHKNAKIAFDRLGKCLEDVKLWVCANKLKLNADKTDFIIFGSKSQQDKLNPFFPVNILGESLIPSDAVKKLGVWFDSGFSFTKHVKSVRKLCFIQMRDLRQIKVRQCAYNTRLSQSDGIILHVPQYQPSIYKSTKQFGLSFAYDAPKIWNELPDDVRSATSIASFRKKLKAYLFCQAYPP